MLVKTKKAVEAVIKQIHKKPELMDVGIEEIYSICKDESRTGQQNRGLHKDCSIIAEKLNDAGYTVQGVIKIDIPFTTKWVKEYMWRPIQKKLYGKKSTTQLKKTGEIDLIHKTLMQQLGEKLGIEYHPFPHDPAKQQENELQPLPDDYPDENNDPDAIQDAFDKV